MEVYDNNGDYVLFDGETGLANCKMMATSPEMYKLLYCIVVLLDTKTAYSSSIGSICGNIVNRARATLAKASGESEVCW